MGGEGTTVLASRLLQGTEEAPAVGLGAPLVGTTRAVVLAGGLGLRLRPYTMVLPKPLIPIGDRPILEHIVRRLAASGVRRVDLCLGRRHGALIQTYFSQAVLPEGLELVCHWEEEPLGTAGALQTIPDLDTPFIATNGDILTTVDFRALLAVHLEQEAALTIAMRRERVNVGLGVIDCEDGRITGYREKPSLHYDVSIGIYVYGPRALRLLPRKGPFQFPELVLRLLEAGERVVPFRTDAVWFDIGTISEYERALRHVESCPELLEPYA
jgi:NDP-sugar pyrophosphorylase family protein